VTPSTARAAREGPLSVVDHRPVIDGQQLLAHGLGERMQPGAGAAGADDASKTEIGKVEN